jgi:hypothetical protein
MNLSDIKNREITCTLSPEDALGIAAAFRTVVQFDHTQAGEQILCEIYASFFEAAAIAAAAHSYAELPDDWGLDKVRAALSPLTLDRGEG